MRAHGAHMRARRVTPEVSPPAPTLVAQQHTRGLARRGHSHGHTLERRDHSRPPAHMQHTIVWCTRCPNPSLEVKAPTSIAPHAISVHHSGGFCWCSGCVCLTKHTRYGAGCLAFCEVALSGLCQMRSGAGAGDALVWAGDALTLLRLRRRRPSLWPETVSSLVQRGGGRTERMPRRCLQRGRWRGWCCSR